MRHENRRDSSVSVVIMERNVLNPGRGTGPFFSQNCLDRLSARGQSGQTVRLATHRHVPTKGTRTGVVPPQPHTPSWQYSDSFTWIRQEIKWNYVYKVWTSYGEEGLASRCRREGCVPRLHYCLTPIDQTARRHEPSHFLQPCASAHKKLPGNGHRSSLIYEQYQLSQCSSQNGHRSSLIYEQYQLSQCSSQNRLDFSRHVQTFRKTRTFVLSAFEPWRFQNFK